MIRPDQDPSGRMAEFAANIKYEDIPDEQKDYIKRDVLDSMASLLGGSTGPTVDTVLKTVRSYGATGKGRALIFGDELPEVLAALVNGTIARAVDMGDTGIGGHVSEWIIPAMLSAISRAEKPVSGKDFIAAFAVGAEWGTREHTTIRLQSNNKLVPGECAGSRYATVAVAKMFGFNKEEIWSAAGMAYCARPMTTQQKYAEDTPDARLQHGFIAADAIQITDLIKRGLKSVHGIYMGQAGLLKSIRHSNLESPDTLTEGLGEMWIWRENISNKLYGGCYYFHALVYGVLELMKQHNIKREDIAGIHFVTSPSGDYTFVPHDVRYAPQAPDGAMFSGPYSISHAVFTGDCFLEAYSKETFNAHMADPEFRHFMTLLTQESDPNIKSTFENYITTITLKNGRKVSCVVDSLPGGKGNSITWEQVVEKFYKSTKYSAIDLGRDKYETIISICKNLENIADMSCLVEALVP